MTATTDNNATKTPNQGTNRSIGYGAAGLLIVGVVHPASKLTLYAES